MVAATDKAAVKVWVRLPPTASPAIQSLTPLPAYSAAVWPCSHLNDDPMHRVATTSSDGVKAMTDEAKAKDLTCHAALKPQTLYTVQC